MKYNSKSNLDWKALFQGKVFDFCKKYLGNGYRIGNDWYVGDIYNSRGDSTQICLNGAKEGFWIDNANPDERGNFIELLAKLEGIHLTDENFGAQLLELCSKYLGSVVPVDLPKPPKDFSDSEEMVTSELVGYGVNPMTKFTIKTKKKSLKTIERLISGAIHIKGTPAESYFKKRMLDGIDTANPNIFYVKDLIVPPSHTFGQGNEIKKDAVVFIIKNYNNEVTGLQRVFIESDGRKVAKQHSLNGETYDLVNKASLGSLSGSFFKIGEDASVVGVCEGIETGMAVRMLTDYKYPIYATLGTSGLVKFRPPKNCQKVVIYADDDVAGKEASLKLKDALAIENRNLSIVITTPKENISRDVEYYNRIKDFNDLLEHGITTIVNQGSSIDILLQKCRNDIDEYIKNHGLIKRMNLDCYQDILDIICQYFHNGYKSDLKIPFEAIVKYLQDRQKSSAIFTDDVTINKANVSAAMQHFIRRRMNLEIPSSQNANHLSIMQEAKQTVEDDAIIMAKEVLETYLLGGDGIIYARSMFYVYGVLSLDLDSVPRTHWIPYKIEQIEAFCADFLEKHRIVKKTNTMMSHMALYLSRKAHKFQDSDPFLQVRPIINCKNGELHIKSDGSVELKPHHYSSYLTYCLDTLYDEEASCPEFENMVERVFITDKEKILTTDSAEDKRLKNLERDRMLRMVQMMFGYFIQPNRWLTKFFFWEGRSASNGKSSLVKILGALIGEKNILSMNIHDLQTQFGLFPTLGKLVIVDDDASTSKPLSESILKKLSSNSVNLVNQKSKDQYAALNIAVPLIVTNNTIKIDEVGSGLSRRIIIIPFQNKFQTVVDAENPVTKVIKTEMSGVLNWAIQGFRMLLENQNIFVPNKVDDKQSLDIMPRRVRDRIREYLAQANDFRIFWTRYHVYCSDKRQPLTIAYVSAYFKKYLYNQGLFNGGRYSEEDICNELQEYFGIEVSEHLTKSQVNGFEKREKVIFGYALQTTADVLQVSTLPKHTLTPVKDSVTNIGSHPYSAKKQSNNY